jgi:hypothetical protein
LDHDHKLGNSCFHGLDAVSFALNDAMTKGIKKAEAILNETEPDDASAPSFSSLRTR